MGKKAKKPKKECCSSKPKCSRCPLRMLADGTLPAGYTVKKRKLVKVGKKSSQGKKKNKKKTSATPLAA